MNAGNRVRCRRVVAMLAEHAGSIPKGTGRALKEHLGACPSCASYRETLQKTVALFGTAVDVKTPEPVRRRIEERL